jgi:hypothetical protein
MTSTRLDARLDAGIGGRIAAEAVSRLGHAAAAARAWSGRA